jgi:putative transposase
MNAALNILQKGISRVGHTQSNAWGQTPFNCVGEILHDYVDSGNQESPSLSSRGVSMPLTLRI